MICAIYCRYSSEAQRNSLSIESQRRACEEFAAKQGWTVYRVYVDEARSGASDRREAFQRMITDAVASPPRFQTVLVHKSDRFARNREDAVKYKALLKRQGVRFASATEPIGSGDVTEVLLESMLDGMAEFYNLQLSQRTLAGMAEAARNGWSIGKPPFGYRHVPVQTPKGPKKKLAPDPAQARIVRRIFSLYAKGDGVQTIRGKLAGQKVMSQNFLFWLLRNEKYIGRTVFGKHPAKSSKTSMDPIRIENTHEPIVDMKTWGRVQELLEKRSAAAETRFVQSEYVLSGILRCSCGAAMVGHAAHGNGGRFRYYGCSATFRKGKKACGRPSVNALGIEERVFGQIKEYLTDKENVLGLIDAHNAALERLQKGKAGEAARVRSDVARKDAAARNLMKAVEAGQGLNLGHVAARLDEISRDKTSLEDRIRQLEAFRLVLPISLKDSERFVDYLQKIFASGLIQNKTLFQGLIQAIDILPDGRSAKVTYNAKLHPQAEVVGWKGSHDLHLVAPMGCHVNLLGSQMIILRAKCRRLDKRKDPAPARLPERGPIDRGRQTPG